ncbi:CoA transferase [Aliifodinibius sp. S!AR15-10]|uniref:CaiB/BaiF CoA transferase family protein n=1 Tax=Aliifodinibius sp. S!AR15-10 TaxID=2950437 RepID=UPI0028579ECF|nr:CaiB/BaiF CoA-transferase family protein [Aliifodinibius sp. S!AR15-10]MDR8391182.1 CoA transferase [Aliifodinibius sp. S!AR15-10]
MNKPLEDILVIDFSQFLSGPSASLRMADLGARVIKIERPGTGDICRDLYISNVIMNGESSVFHAINRNKESYVADLKDEADRSEVWQLIERADVVMHNFRPGVMERLGFDYESVKKVKPDIVYGEISGYGPEGPWKSKPGQDLLVQSLTGLTWLSGSSDKGPVPMGLAIVDILTGTHLAQGIMACLVRKGINGDGGLVQVSMLESAVDFQFETITTYFNDGGHPAERSKNNNAHAYIGAPYGIYQTKSGYMALAMGSIPHLGKLLDCPELLNYQEESDWYDKRDEIKGILANHLAKGTTRKWLDILEPADIWCAEVLSWDDLMDKEGFHLLNMIQEVTMDDGYSYKTTRCPISFDGEPIFSDKGSPQLGEDTEEISNEFIREHIQNR